MSSTSTTLSPSTKMIMKVKTINKEMRRFDINQPDSFDNLVSQLNHIYQPHKVVKILFKNQQLQQSIVIDSDLSYQSALQSLHQNQRQHSSQSQESDKTEPDSKIKQQRINSQKTKPLILRLKIFFDNDDHIKSNQFPVDKSSRKLNQETKERKDKGERKDRSTNFIQNQLSSDLESPIIIPNQQSESNLVEQSTLIKMDQSVSEVQSSFTSNSSIIESDNQPTQTIELKKEIKSDQSNEEVKKEEINDQIPSSSTDHSQQSISVQQLINQLSEIIQTISTQQANSTNDLSVISSTCSVDSDQSNQSTINQQDKKEIKQHQSQEEIQDQINKQIEVIALFIKSIVDFQLQRSSSPQQPTIIEIKQLILEVFEGMTEQQTDTKWLMKLIETIKQLNRSIIILKRQQTQQAIKENRMEEKKKLIEQKRQQKNQVTSTSTSK